MTAPSPPPGFRGSFTASAASRREHGSASGPFRILPAAVAEPRDAGDVARLVEWAAHGGHTLVPRGAGTGMPGHNVGTGVSVDLRSLDAVSPVDRETRTIRVGPGAVAADVAEVAARAGLSFPPLPSSADRCTIGGMVANNAAGARSFRHGSVRDWVVRLDVVLADGELRTLGPGESLPPALRSLEVALASARPLLDGWPRVRKNSSGYALDRFLRTGSAVDLLVGSEGTLGIVTAVTLRLAPPPEGRRVLLVGLPYLDALPAAAERARSAGASACEFFGQRIIDMAGLARDPEVGTLAACAEGLLLLEVEGDAHEVAEGAAALSDLAAEVGTGTIEAAAEGARRRLWDLRHRASPTIARAAERGLRSMQFIEDCVVPVPALPTWVAGLREILDEAETDAVVFGHAGDGNLHVNPLVDTGRDGWRERVRRILEDTVGLVARLGGTLSGEHGDGRVRAPYLERIWGEGLARAFRAVKDGLDAEGVLNPGVILPLPGQDPLEGLDAGAAG